jgi:hypothetical protein
MTTVEEPLRVGLMLRDVCSLEDDIFVPVDAEPAQPFENRARAVVGRARLVSVLDAEEELAP